MRKENNKNSAASTDSDANAKSGGDASPTAPTEEEAEEISANEQQKEQRKSLDALYAAAREEFDLDMSPLDSAMKTLREGREIQKLSVLRNLVELVEGEPDEALHRLLPMMQGLLSVTPSNLDIHCEAAIAYKNCIKEKKLQQKCPELPDRFLVAILENIEAQKENVTATAWLESLVDIADCVSMQSIVNMVVPLAVAQADSGKRVQRRVISTRLIEKLALLVPKEILQRELSPCAQMLCQDPSAAVRTSIAQKLSMLAQSLNNSTDCCTLLLPCIIQLCKDEDPSVREAILSSMALCLPHFSKDAKKSVLLPLLRKCTEQALILRDASLPIVSRHFGSWLHCLRDILTPAELRWWLDTYVRILDFACQQNACNNAIQQQATAQKQASVENGTPPAVAGNAQQQKQQQLCVACRRMCAYNFPCFVAVFGEETDVFSGRLLPILEQFCRDSDDEVRSIIASGFHEIVAQRKIAPMGTKNAKNSSSISASVPLLLGPFVDLLSSGNADIVQQLTANLHRILPILYAEISASATKKRTHLIFAKLDRILVNCNNLMKGSGSWRAHEAYLNGIAVLRNLVSTKDLLSNFVPLLKQEVLTARALPCRIAAAQTLLLMMREFTTSRTRHIVKFFVHEIGHHSNCYRRRLLLDIVPLLLQYFSREFFIDKFFVHEIGHHSNCYRRRLLLHTEPSLLQYFSREIFIDKFLPAVLKLSADPISHIRLQLCRTLPKIKQYLMFPNNDESLSNLECVVRELLASETKALSRQFIQQQKSQQNIVVTFSLVAESIYALLSRSQTLTVADLIIRASFHESGHTLLLWLLREADEHVRTILVESPIFKFGETIAKAKPRYSANELFARLQMQFGGTVAEFVVYGNVLLDHDDESGRQHLARYIEHYFMHKGERSYPYVANSYLPEFESLPVYRQNQVRKLLADAKSAVLRLFILPINRRKIEAVAYDLRIHFILSHYWVRSILGAPLSDSA